MEKKVREDVAKGRMRKMTYKDANEMYGEDLLIGALGLVDEGKDKFRVIHDATHKVLVNNRFRTRDHQPSPMVTDISTEMAEVESTQERHLGRVWDCESAHRRVLVHPVEWGRQA